MDSYHAAFRRGFSAARWSTVGPIRCVPPVRTITITRPAPRNCTVSPGPWLAAAALHSFLDGWSVAPALAAAPLGLRVAVPLAVALHKLPEGMALAGILRAAVKSRAGAWAGACGRGRHAGGRRRGFWMAPAPGQRLGSPTPGPHRGLAVLPGLPRVHQEWKRRGAAPAFLSAAAGAAGAALIQRAARRCCGSSASGLCRRWVESRWLTPPAETGGATKARPARRRRRRTQPGRRSTGGPARGHSKKARTASRKPGG